jgi:ribonuclease III
MNPTDFSEIENALSYRFKNTAFIEESLHHSSYANEQNDPNIRDNERLEFLGDAVINLVVGHILINRYPDTKEGDLSKMRANLVNESSLAELAKHFNIGAHIKLGKGELQSDGFKKDSILADAFEAVLAAIYLDGGFSAAFDFIQDSFDSLFEAIASPDSDQDYKSRLQELLQAQKKDVPQYLVLNESGPDHDKMFEVQIQIDGLTAVGTGKSKKRAEQSAAKKALEWFPDFEAP